VHLCASRYFGDGFRDAKLRLQKAGLRLLPE
jgi:hypothetical protein